MKIHSTLLLALCGALLSTVSAEENWYQFRGPLGTGHTADTDVPLKWDENSVVWRTEIKGDGQSSPVNWGDKMFVTSSNSDGTERYVICLSKKDGSILWEKTVSVSAPEKPHNMNSWATPSCATNGKVVVGFFRTGRNPRV